MNKLFERLCEVRHLDSDFLHPKYESLSDPYLIPDMEKAVNRIKEAIKNQEKILIYGDYDVDGVTSSTLMEEALTLAGANSKNIEIMLPDRFADGYGMSPKLVKRAEKDKINLVITVDCGSRNHEIINELNALRIDTIVTDHHETDEKMPEALAIINPHRKDKPVEKLQNLAGVGVAFKVAEALEKAKMIEKGQEKWLLDLVVLGTISDNMLLTGENHILGFYGLKVLAKTRRPGLIELMHRAGVKKLNSESIGFQIGPRLNAAGRLETAELSLDLLRSRSESEAAAFTEKLETLNKKRKIEQISATKEIIERGEKPDPVIIETGDWHEGVLGIVAGRLVEEFKKPAFVLTETVEGVFKGSGRSFGEFNLAEALTQVQDLILSGGGHALAAGVKVEQKNLYAFRERINEYYKSLNLKNQEKYLKQAPDLDIENLSECSLEFLEALKLLEPFGQGNEEPIFCLKNVEIDLIRKMGAENQHLRLDVKDKSGHILKLVSFYTPEKWFSFDYDTKIEPIVKLTENDFNGVKSVEARILDINMI